MTALNMDGPAMTGKKLGFKSGGLELTGYLYLPAGDGPHPCMVDNHGSQTPQGTSDVSHPQTAAALTAMGYAYFFPNRAGYGDSPGTPLGEEVPAERGTPEHDDQIIRRLDGECGDVIAALDALGRHSDIDGGRIGVMGSSLGGILSLMALARDERWSCAVDFSGGASQWTEHPKCRAMILDAARALNAPVMLIQPENDFNTAPTKEISKLLDELGKTHEAMIFPSWGVNAPEAHRFAATGAQVWGPHMSRFLERHL